jgi:hypothetical protein
MIVTSMKIGLSHSDWMTTKVKTKKSGEHPKIKVHGTSSNVSKTNAKGKAEVILRKQSLNGLTTVMNQKKTTSKGIGKAKVILRKQSLTALTSRVKKHQGTSHE